MLLFLVRKRKVDSSLLTNIRQKENLFLVVVLRSIFLAIILFHILNSLIISIIIYYKEDSNNFVKFFF